MTRVSGCIILIIFLISSNTYPQNNDTSVKEQHNQSDQSIKSNTDPVLVADGPFEFPLECIKRGVKGTLVVAIDIDNKGVVENCIVKQGLNPLLDSAIIKSIMHSLYKPAIESGQTVASSVVLELSFDYEQIVRNSRFDPVFDGYITDRESGTPLRNAVVNIAPFEIIIDTTIFGGIDKYLQLIGTAPDQKCTKGFITTSTDSTGYFSFKLLPSANYKVSVLIPGFEIAQYQEIINGGRVSVRYALDYYREIMDSTYSITVYGLQNKHREVIHLEYEQMRNGLTHYASKVILSKSTVRSVPESPSQMLVRLGSPYDNRYNIGGVMMLAPFHFGGHPYADIDGLMVSALENVDIVVNDIAGTAPDVSGIVVNAEPGIYRPADKELKPRPEFSLDFSTTSQDFLISAANQRGDFLQLGYTRSEDYTLKMLSNYSSVNDRNAYGLGIPVSFGNVTSNTEFTLKDITTKTFLWLAYDVYKRNYQETIVPWGMGSIVFTPRYNKHFTVTCGGSHQYFSDGVINGVAEIVKKVELSNACMSVSMDSLATGNVEGVLKYGLNYTQWHGKAEQVPGRGEDTLIYDKSEEMSLNVNGELKYSTGKLTLKSKCLANVISYNLSEADYSMDGGVGISLNEQSFLLSFDAGVVHSHPDVRGLPDARYRKHKSQSILISCLGKYFRNDKFVVSVIPFMRYQLDVPKLSPDMLVWNKNMESDVVGGGIDIDMFFLLFDKVELSGALNFSNGKRVGEEKEIYEWNIPLTIRGKIHAKFYQDLLHVYVDMTKSRGLPYYDFTTLKYRRLPDYNSVDFSLQYRSKYLERRFLSQYCGYFVVHNILGAKNIRGYQWYSQDQKVPVYISYTKYIEFGVKLALRL
jgi:hypothetical protein